MEGRVAFDGLGDYCVKVSAPESHSIVFQAWNSGMGILDSDRWAFIASVCVV